MPPKNDEQDDARSPLADIFFQTATHRDEQIEELQESLAKEQDARREDQFIFIVIGTILLDVVFFSVIDGIAALSIIILELLILIPLARRMGMQEISQLISRLLDRVSGNFKNDNSN